MAPLEQERAEWGLVGERFPARYGRLDVDVLIEPGTGDSLHHLATEDPATGFVNTRVEFVGFDRSIQVRFGDFSFRDEETIGAFTPGVPVRVGIEATPAGVLRVYLDGALAYTGTERAAAQFGDLRAGKIGRVSAWSLVESGDASTSIAIDNIVFTPDPCPTDFNEDGVTDTADLALLLQRWRAVVPRGSADVNADETVDGADLAALLGAFGPSDPEDLPSAN